MRVNIYAEEMSEDIEIISKEIDGRKYTGLRIYLYLPVTATRTDGNPPDQLRGKFMHREGDDDSSAITFWGKRDLREVLMKAIKELDKHYGEEKPFKRLCNRFLVSNLNLKEAPLDGSRCKKEWKHDGDCK